MQLTSSNRFPCKFSPNSLIALSLCGVGVSQLNSFSNSGVIAKSTLPLKVPKRVHTTVDKNWKYTKTTTTSRQRERDICYDQTRIRVGFGEELNRLFSPAATAALLMRKKFFSRSCRVLFSLEVISAMSTRIFRCRNAKGGWRGRTTIQFYDRTTDRMQGPANRIPCTNAPMVDDSAHPRRDRRDQRPVRAVFMSPSLNQCPAAESAELPPLAEKRLHLQAKRM